MAEEMMAEEMMAKEMLAEEMMAEEMMAKEMLAEEMMAKEMMAKEMMAEEMMAEEMMAEAETEAAMEFCADVAKGKDDAAMKFVDAALAFQCGKHGTKAGCDELTKDKEAGLAVVAGKLGCKSSEKSTEAPSE